MTGQEDVYYGVLGDSLEMDPVSSECGNCSGVDRCTPQQIRECVGEVAVDSVSVSMFDDGGIGSVESSIDGIESRTVL